MVTVDDYSNALKQKSFEKIVAYGLKVASKFGKHDKEFWEIHDQIAKSSSHLGYTDIVEKSIEFLSHHFKDSTRVRNLALFALEADNVQEALTEYKGILDADKTDNAIIRASIRALISKHDYSKAAALLNQYVSSNPLDAIAWKFLMFLHIENGAISDANFCCDELILLDNNNEHYYQIKGELLSSQNDHKNAINYFSKSILISSNNYISLWGILLSIQAMKESNTKENMKELGASVKSLLLEVYTEQENKFNTIACEIINEL